LKRAAITGESHVLDVGGGVGTTAVTIAERFGAEVTAVDIEPLMLERANEAVRAAHAADRVHIQEGDILALDFPDNSFDVVIAEAVTMLVDRALAARELIRVCRPGGRVHATEFMWRRERGSARAFLGQVCPGLRFDTAEDWVRIYSEAGLSNVEIDEGPFEMMSPQGFRPRRRSWPQPVCHGAGNDSAGLHEEDGLAHAADATGGPLPRLHRR
jgi:SAM-dependent methyltransferase